MRVFRWRDSGREIGHFDSRLFTHFRLARSGGEAAVSAVELNSGGVIGRHEAGARQLFVIVTGSGEVIGRDGEVVPVAAGDAVVWELGEEHETRSAEGLLAIVLEGGGIDPAQPA